MIKASEPLFVLILSYYILQEQLEYKVNLTLIPICLGVSLIVFGELSFNLIGFISVFSANLASASRNVFYKLELSEAAAAVSSSNSGPSDSSFRVFLNVGFLSFILYLPFYLIGMFFFRPLLFANDPALSIISILNQFSDSEILKPLLFGSLFNFLYNLFSFQVLSNISPLSHSILNITKRVLIVCFSLAYFSTKITKVQMIGMLGADCGVFLYSYFKMKSKSIKISISKSVKDMSKMFILFFLCFILAGSFFVNYEKPKMSNKVDIQQITTDTTTPAETSSTKYSLRQLNQLQKRYFLNDQMRIKCIQTIRNQIINIFTGIIPKDRRAHLLNLPFHNNYGDTLIWLGEEILIKELGLNLSDYGLYNKPINFLEENVNKNDTILMHGGGNFGDLWRIHTNYRNAISTKFRENQLVFLPQTINYQNTDSAIEDAKVYANVSNLTVTVRGFDSLEFAQKYFGEKNRVLFSPDMAFMIGNLNPIQKPIYDVFILKRTDKESKYGKGNWKEAIDLLKANNYTYLAKDWFDYKIKVSDNKDMCQKRLVLVNEIISQGKVILTDRLHASIFSLLIGKPHVIVDEKFKKIYNTREAAFRDKKECNQEYLNGYYSSDPIDGAQKSMEILEELKYLD